MKIFTLLFIVTILVSCGNANIELPAEYSNHRAQLIEGSNDAQIITLFSEDKSLESGILVDTIRQGPWITYHRKAYTPHIVANYKDGILEGTYNEFNDNGELKIHAFCTNGNFEGLYKEYLEGTLIKRQSFVNGKVNGNVENFYPETGLRMSALNYKDGVQDGISTYYNENGIANLEYTYENGEQISSREIPVE